MPLASRQYFAIIVVAAVAAVTAARSAAPHPPKLVLPGGHTAPVRAVAFSPDGSVVASAGDDSVRLWDMRSGLAAHTLTGMTHVRGLAFAPDGAAVAAAGSDGANTSAAVRLWSDEGKPLLRLSTDSTGVTSIDAVAFTPDGRLIATGGSHWERPVLRGQVILWGRDDGERLRTFGDLPTTVEAVAFSPGGRLLVGACENGTVQIWDMPSGTRRRTMQMHGPLGLVRFVNERVLAVQDTDPGTGAPQVSFWNVAREGKPRVVTGRNLLAVSGDGKVAASKGKSGLDVWDTASGRIRRGAAVKPDGLECAALSPDGNKLAMGGTDQTVRIWNAGSGTLAREFMGSASERITALLPTSGGIATLSPVLWGPGRVTTARIWDTATGTQRACVQTQPQRGFTFPLAKPSLAETLSHLHPLLQGSIALSPDGKQLASVEGTYNRWSLVLRDSRTGELLKGIANSVGPIAGLAYSPDSRTVAATTSGIHLWDTRTGAPIRTLPADKYAWGTASAFAPDGGTLASASSGTVTLWSVKDGSRGRTFGGADTRRRIASLVFAPDGGTLAMGVFTYGDYPTSAVELWDVRSGARRSVAVREAPDDGLSSGPFVAYVHGGRLLAVAGGSQVRLYDVSTRALRATMRGLPSDTGRSNWLAHTPSGAYTGSAGVERFLRWDTGTELLPGRRLAGEYRKPQQVTAAVAGR